MTGREPCPACHVLYQASVTGPCIHRPERRKPLMPPTGTAEAVAGAMEASSKQPPAVLLYHEEKKER